MTTTTAPPAPPPEAPPRLPVAPARLDWLTEQVAHWRADGIVDDAGAAAILARYRPTHHLSLSRLLLGVGGSFLGTGLVWLVAANIDALPPLVRFGAVSLIWLALLVAGELVAARRGHSGPQGSPVAEAVRLAAAVAYGAVVFQAAQSLQVPAYEPDLLGWWAVGALLHAYAVRGVAPLVVGVLAGVGWFVWDVVAASPSAASLVLALVAASVLAAGAASLHDRWAPAQATPWREAGAALGLAGLFTAALPISTFADHDWSPALVAVLAGAAVLAVAGAAAGGRVARHELAGTVAAAGASAALVAWVAGESLDVTLPDVAHAVVAVVAYILAAVGVAVVGAVRGSWRLTALAMLSLVVFTTVQAFAVFARILDGAWLFVVLGAVLLGTGYLFDRARRELVADLSARMTASDEGTAR